MALIKFARGTLAKISAATKDANTVYLATDKQALYLGDNLVTSNVADATFSGNVLTITKVDDSIITLDFNDVASASGVNSLLASLRTDVNKNKTDISNVSTRLNTLSGQVTANKVIAGDKSIVVTTANASTSVKVGISTTANNQLTLDANGLYVAKPAAYTGANAIKVSGQSISIALDGGSLSQSATGIKSTLKLQKMSAIDSSLASAYQLVDGAGTMYGDPIEIVKDQFLKSVTLDASDNLVFVFATTTGDSTSKVNIAKYIDTYTAGNGITVTNKSIAVKVKSGDAYLTVDGNGVASKGIDAAITTAVNNASTAWNTKLNSAKSNIDASITALKNSVAGVMVYAADTTTIVADVSNNKTTFSVKAGIYDAAGAATTAKNQVLGAAADASSAITVYGVKAYAKAYAEAQGTSAKNAAATDATTKVNALKGATSDTSAAITVYGVKAHATEIATSKASAAQTAAANDATSKVNALKGAAADASSLITVYGVKAYAKAYAEAQANSAKSAAATDATTKANNALASAKSYTDAALTWVEL